MWNNYGKLKRWHSPTLLIPNSSYIRAGSRFAPSQCVTVLFCNDVSHWVGAKLESALYIQPLVGGAVAINDNRLKFTLNSNLARSRFAVIYCTIVKSFWKFAQSMAISLPCSGQIFKMIRQLVQILWTNEIARDLSLRWVFGRIFHIAIAIGSYLLALCLLYSGITSQLCQMDSRGYHVIQGKHR